MANYISELPSLSEHYGIQNLENMLWQNVVWTASVQKLLAEMALPSRRPHKQWSWQSARPKIYMPMVGAQKKLLCTRPNEQKFPDLL